MPIEPMVGASKSTSKSSTPKMAEPVVVKPAHGCTSKYSPCNDFAKKILLTLFGVLLLYGIVFLATLIRNNLQKFFYIGRADRVERTVTIDGEAKVTALPDVGVVSMGVIAKADTIADAQKQSTDTMNSLIAKLNALGVKKTDIQTTNYNIYPKMKYSPTKGDEPDGFEINQGVTIKIRDVTKSNEVLALAGQVGANNVNGVQFIVDDPEVYRAEAREKALDKIGEKMLQLANTLGVKFVSVVSYNEFPNTTQSDYYGYAGSGMGGGGPAQSGSNDVVVRVSVTYEIR